MTDATRIPVDPESEQRLAGQDLTYRLIDPASDADAEAFLRADARGFLGEEPSADLVAADRAGIAERRNIGVFEAGAPVGTWPVATVNSWVAPLTVPGGEIGMWAISAVTVSGTHRRRGIARALLEGELRPQHPPVFRSPGSQRLRPRSTAVTASPPPSPSPG